MQVETVGDKYMAVSGLPDICDNHSKCIARLALDMMDMAKNVKMGPEPVVSIFVVLISSHYSPNQRKFFVIVLYKFYIVIIPPIYPTSE